MSDHPVVAGYRGLDSAGAVGVGSLLARALHEPLVLACAYRYDAAGLSARALPAPDNGRRAAGAEHMLQQARRFVGADVDVREQIIPAAGVSGALIALARDVDASILVLGRDTEGRVSRSIVQRAPCPVAIAPLTVPTPGTRPIERIGIAYDGSLTAQRALVAGARLAAGAGARLVVLAVGPTTEHALTWLGVARLSLGPHVDLEERALVGSPSEALANASGDLDLLVCGTRGRTRPLAAILGSVSAHLIAHSRCPLVVMPPTARRGESGPLGIAPAAAA